MEGAVTATGEGGAFSISCEELVSAEKIRITTRNSILHMYCITSDQKFIYCKCKSRNIIKNHS